MKKNGFAPILIVLIVAIIGIGFYFFYRNQLLDREPSGPSRDGLKTYRNDTYGIEFQYDKNSMITYERKDGKQYIEGKLVSEEYKQMAVDDIGPIVSLDDNSLEVTIGGRKMKDDVGYFSLEIRLNDRADWGKNSILNNCDEGAPKGTNTIVNKYGIKLWLSDYTGQYEQRIACLRHGKYIWILSTQFTYPVNKDKIIKLFDLIVSSFRFTK